MDDMTNLIDEGTGPGANKPARIPIDDADLPTLKHFAETALGLDIRHGTNATTVRTKIRQAIPDIKDVPPLAPAPAPIVAPAAPVIGAIGPAPEIVERAIAAGYDAATENPAVRPAAVSRPATMALRNPKLDPKVTLTVNRTDDKRRAREVTVEVNGYTWRMQRGVKIELPYRAYLALDAAQEKVLVETDETNPITGLPVMDWQEQHSYPFMVHSMPSAEEIAAWHAATGDGFANAA